MKAWESSGIRDDQMTLGAQSDSGLSPDKAALAAELRADVEKATAMRALARQSAADQADRARLRAFQAERLARTYADLLASPRYGRAAKFFLTDLYGVKDRAERDETVSKVVPILSRMLPAGAVRGLAIAVRLDALSEELDLAMVRALREEGGVEGLDAARYARAWQRCGNRPARERQIALIMEAGQVLDRMTKITSVGIALRLMRGPAHAAGFGAVQDFLESGFLAFAHMGDASEFLSTIRDREAAVAAKLFAGEPLDIP
jgi:hypothetical protein